MEEYLEYHLNHINDLIKLRQLSSSFGMVDLGIDEMYPNFIDYLRFKLNQCTEEELSFIKENDFYQM